MSFPVLNSSQLSVFKAIIGTHDWKQEEDWKVKLEKHKSDTEITIQ